MDRGAARSRKREQQAQKDKEQTAKPAEGSSRPVKPLRGDKGKFNNNKSRKDGDEDDEDKKGKGVHPDRRQEKQDPNPELYTSKAIRTARALVYSQQAFELPPPAERLAGVTRVDLEGSSCTDVSWLAGTGVTWLSVKGCHIEKGWDAIGGLEGLAVLNISACGRKTLPKELGDLSKLKAVVAMNNEWSSLDAEVVGGWSQLNSLIVSHSPVLSSLPTTLSTLPHLAKLTFSHCPRLDARGLPDLSALPLLRDVRANNLPRLESLPSHLATWGTGSLALVGKDKDDAGRKGDGLEVLDVGNCSLPFSAVTTAFGLGPTATKPKNIWHLRMLTLQANPLALEEPKYAELLQASPAMPRLQIIDSKRVVERKRAGVAPETKQERRARERREKKMQPTGANAGNQKMRTWGGAGKDDVEAEGDEKEEGGDRKRQRVEGGKPEKRRREDGKSDKPRSERPKSDRPRSDKPRGDKPRGERPERSRTDKGDKAERKPVEKKRKERYFDFEGDDETPAATEPKTSKPSPAAKGKAPATPAPVSAPTPVAAAVEVAEPERKKRKRKHGKNVQATPAVAVPVAEKPAAAPVPVKAAEKATKPAVVKPARAPAPAPAPVPIPAPVSVVKADPSTARKTGKPSKSQTAVVGVVDVVKRAGGVDLKSMFGGAKEVGAGAKDEDSGLGLGGW